MATIVHDIAGLLAQQISAGSGSARVTIGDKAQAFAWAPAVTNAAVKYFDSIVSESTNAKIMKVEHNIDVMPWTTGDKPITASISVEDIALAVYPGVVEIKTTSALDAHNLGAAVTQALYAQSLAALDRAVIADLKANGTNIPKAADLASIAEAQATLMSDGFNPGLVIASASVYATLAGSSMLVGGNDPQQAQQSVLGSRLVVSSALTGAQAVVVDPASVVVVEHAQSPVCLMDVHARKNTTEVVIEVVAAHAITQNFGVCSVFNATK